jgi:hypothetical protein
MAESLNDTKASKLSFLLGKEGSMNDLEMEWLANSIVGTVPGDLNGRWIQYWRENGIGGAKMTLNEMWMSQGSGGQSLNEIQHTFWATLV